ncbi:hypothetical protein [Nocardiopsis aegyptia]|uniref:Uncharacterized protein n=1 Tax=Nocardiopsis aegyptia TaxID=220378 RepID=A0A7Z0JBU7_9ACTN|nr:hypothetical protein [Nocardiopsis aegyptia]NYJ35794.1 hypothetical protein [Nocardiopsis aegyptia]
MRLERVQPTVVRATMHVREIAALMTAVRQVADGTPQDVPEEARRQLRSLLETYDEQVRRLDERPGPAPDVPGQEAGSG